jgi:hypothetical protein
MRFDVSIRGINSYEGATWGMVPLGYGEISSCKLGFPSHTGLCRRRQISPQQSKPLRRSSEDSVRVKLFLGGGGGQATWPSRRRTALENRRWAQEGEASSQEPRSRIELSWGSNTNRVGGLLGLSANDRTELSFSIFSTLEKKEIPMHWKT